VLKILGFYRGEVTGVWDEATEKAFTDWANINNFENKLRTDEYIWGTIYRFLLKQVGKQ
jgi:uncharacterized Ntn-hydrolase superfamily protein